MSKRRRWILIVLGVIQFFLAAQFRFGASWMDSSASFKVVYAKAEVVFEALKEDGAVFSDEEQARSKIQEGLREVPAVASKGMAIASFILGLNGLFFIGFAVWPSRKRKSTKTGDPVEQGT